MAEKLLNYFTLDQWPAIFAGCDKPTDGGLSEYLWRWSNNPNIDCNKAAMLMYRCGYIPYRGYPLHRNGKGLELSKAQKNEIVQLMFDLIERLNR